VRTWAEAWEEALYGPSGFFLRELPLDHFRTNVAVPLFAEAVRRLAGLVDEALGLPDPFDVVDLGAGRGELLAALPDVPARWRLTSVDLAPGMQRDVPAVTGLLIANEWLDNVPVDVVQDGRLVLVARDGQESLGAPLSSEWASQWWPAPAHRVEVGAPRDLAWAAAVARVDRGLAVAIDYGHTVTDRRPTLTGYRHGRQVLPAPDGSCDITAHVALDAVAAASAGVLVSQREALTALGITAALPEAGAPSYPSLLARASQARELLDPDALGGFGWVLNPVAIDLGWMGTWPRS
jgi:SAM-dependent MidA family methyltransferase